MSVMKRLSIALVVAGLAAMGVSAQQQNAAPPATVPTAQAAPALPPPPPRDRIAARVNGQPIPELAAYRLTVQNPKDTRAEALEILIDNAIVEQYLVQIKIKVEPPEVENKVRQMKDEAKMEKQDWNKLLASMFLTEEDLRLQLTAVLRWDHFADQHATEKALRDLFDKQRSIFDGSEVQARHILVTSKTAGNAEQGKARLLVLKKEIEADTARELAKLPAGTSKLDEEKTRMKALEKAFAESAAKISECPSKAEGGNLGWFQRSGTMVEPFAAAAFALKPYQMSEPVTTEFGYHLILATDFKPGKEVQFDKIRPLVREVYCDRLRDAVITALKPRTQIVIEPAAK